MRKVTVPVQYIDIYILQVLFKNNKYCKHVHLFKGKYTEISKYTTAKLNIYIGKLIF